MMAKFKFSTRTPLNLSLYSNCVKNPVAYYGLPQNKQYCSKCVISNQRPMSAVEVVAKPDDRKAHMQFNSKGICSACAFIDQKNSEIRWNERREELLRLCDRHRRNDGSYDCIVPGSGGKDSLYASYVLKEEFGMNPLTVTWAPHIYTDWGWSNFQSWIHSGVDNILYTPNGRVHRLLTRLALENFLHPFQPFMIGQKLLGPRIAKEYGISLVFYGENEAEYGNNIKDNYSPKRSDVFYRVPSVNDARLSGFTIRELLELGLTLNDLKLYLPEFDNSKLYNDCEVQYLGYYLKWHPHDLYYFAREHSNFRPSPERNCGTYSKYSSLDDKLDDLHYYTTGVKFGLGRASYDAAQEVRNGDLLREEAVSLVRQFDHEYPARFLVELLEYLSIDVKWFSGIKYLFQNPTINKQYFDALCDSFRSPHLWKYSRNEGWKLRVSIDEV